jgi:hypothetical protein
VFEISNCYRFELLNRNDGWHEFEAKVICFDPPLLKVECTNGVEIIINTNSPWFVSASHTVDVSRLGQVAA